MPTELVIAVTAVLMLLGLAGSVLPLLPGSPLIVLGALLYGWHTDFTVITWLDLIVLGAIALLGQLLDYAATALGARKFGAGRWGMTGAFAGGMLGVFFGGIIGIIFGSFFGAVILEYITGKTMKVSLQTGLGALLGFLGGAIGKFVLSVVMVGIFIVQLLQ
jgi:hypothetical protein